MAEENQVQSESGKNKKGVKSFIKKYWLTFAVLLYLVSPFDLLPEGFLPAIGQVDDALLALIELLRQWHRFKNEKDSD
jgi:uncharacterized membrane protein YkvA (DUF1232 family)